MKLPVPVLINSDLSQFFVTNKIDQKSKPPFFNQWFEKDLVMKVNASETYLSEFFTNPQEKVIPHAFIFHTLRCGSSAIVNYFQNSPNTIVIPEAQPISVFCMRNNRDRENWEYEKERGLNGIFHAYNKFFNYKSDKSLIIKFTSWNILDLHRIKNSYPEIPTLIILRNPIEIIVSLMQTKPGIKYLLSNSTMSYNLFGEDIIFKDDADAYIYILKKFYQSILNVLESHQNILLLDHENLNEHTIKVVQEFIGVPDSQKSTNNSLQYYSKNAGERYYYRNDSKQKINLASDLLIKKVESHCLENYITLKKASLPMTLVPPNSF